MAIRVVVPLPLALRSANAWLWPGPDPVLADSGLGTPEAWQALDAALSANGIERARLRVLLTHGHADHAGNAHRLAAAGARIEGLAEEAPLVATYRRDQAYRHALVEEALRRNGAPEPAIEAVRRRGRRFDGWMEDAPFAPVAPGTTVPLGAGEGVVHAAPGHTAGSLLLALDTNELVTGDTLLEHITSNAIELLDRERGRYAQYLRTLDGLRRWAGCTALPGHHDPFRVTDILLDHHLGKHAARSRKVLAALDRPRTAWELLPHVLPHLAEDQLFLGMCEMVGHLHALEADALVQAEETGGVVRYAA